MRTARKMLGEIFGGPCDDGPDEAAETESNSGLRITGDRATLSALEDVLEMASRSHSNEDIAEWAESATDAISQATAGRANSGNGNVTLPAFKATPSVDSFNDDQGPGPDDEEY
jgi:hypothetical protein